MTSKSASCCSIESSTYLSVQSTTRAFTISKTTANMRCTVFLLPALAAFASATQDPMPTPFTSAFAQPAPPLVKAEFSANYKQHKWNANVSHIVAGAVYFSPSNGKVRADAAFAPSLASSLFDYANISADGGVNNVQWTLSPNVAAKPTVFEGYVQPGFPLFAPDLLVSSGAVYAGFEDGEEGFGVVAKVSSQYHTR